MATSKSAFQCDNALHRWHQECGWWTNSLELTNSLPIGRAAKAVTSVLLLGARLCTLLASSSRGTSTRALREVRALGVCKGNRMGGWASECVGNANGLITGELTIFGMPVITGIGFYGETRCSLGTQNDRGAT